MFRLVLPFVVLAMVPFVVAREKEVAEKEKGSDPLHPRVKMATSLGDIVLELNAEKAPITVENYLRYAEDGYYNSTIFHRVMSTFMIQGGGFTTEMEKKLDGLSKPIKNEWKNGLKNARGTISMARLGGNPDSATSQFFINVVDNSRLDQPQRDGAAYCVFGKVVEGMETVDKIRDAEVNAHPKLKMGKVVPVEPIIIQSVTLLDGLEYTKVYEAAKQAKAEWAKVAQLAKAAKKKDDEALAKSFQELLSKNVDEHGNKLQKTDSGLMYVVLKTGDGSTPKPSDVVVVHYTGWLMDGTKFDSSRDKNKPLVYRLDKLIKGWIEGVGIMKVGGKRRLIIPANLAYGERGSGQIPPNSMLVFDMELLDIK